MFWKKRKNKYRIFGVLCSEKSGVSDALRKVEFNEKLVLVDEDDPNWDGSGVLMVILDGGEPITLQMLKQKRIELEDVERFKLLRELRDKLLSETDYLMNTDYPHKEGMLDKWKKYRQALRDLPINSNPQLDDNGNLDMSSIELPTKPL